MPDIDVTDMLVDPDIANSGFSVIRRTETTANNGRASLATVQTDGLSGSVLPVGDNSLLRDESFTTQMAAIQVITSFRLRGAGVSGAVKFQPDLVVWKGAHYEVRSVEDFTEYGAGMIVAECIMINYERPVTT